MNEHINVHRIYQVCRAMIVVTLTASSNQLLYYFLIQKYRLLQYIGTQKHQQVCFAFIINVVLWTHKESITKILCRLCLFVNLVPSTLAESNSEYEMASLNVFTTLSINSFKTPKKEINDR